MLTFKQFCESREKLQEQNPAKGYYPLREKLMPVFTRNYEYYVMDKTDKKMIKVSPGEIVHPRKSDSNLNEVSVE